MKQRAAIKVFDSDVTLALNDATDIRLDFGVNLDQTKNTESFINYIYFPRRN